MKQCHEKLNNTWSILFGGHVTCTLAKKDIDKFKDYTNLDRKYADFRDIYVHSDKDTKELKIGEATIKEDYEYSIMSVHFNPRQPTYWVEKISYDDYKNYDKYPENEWRRYSKPILTTTDGKYIYERDVRPVIITFKTKSFSLQKT